MKNNIPWNLEISDVVIPKRCPVFGFKMKVLHKDRNRSATLDRIKPELGYIKGNIAVISFRANMHQK